jgi:hypothetical protein
METQNKEAPKSSKQRLDEIEERSLALEANLKTYTEALEQIVGSLSSTMEKVLRLESKLEAVTSSLQTLEVVSQEDLNQAQRENNLKNLENKLNFLLEQKLLEPAEEVLENGFVVGQEETEDGEIVTHRVQFALNILSPEDQAKILGKKVGEVVKFQEGNNVNLYITAVYKEVLK